MIITIPLYTILFGYFFVLLALACFALIDIGHLVKTGTFTMFSFIVTLAFLCFAALVVWSTWYLLQETFWQQPLTVWDNDWISSWLSNNNLTP